MASFLCVSAKLSMKYTMYYSSSEPATHVIQLTKYSLFSYLLMHAKFTYLPPVVQGYTSYLM